MSSQWKSCAWLSNELVLGLTQPNWWKSMCAKTALARRTRQADE